MTDLAARKIGDRVSLRPLGLKGKGRITAKVPGPYGPTVIVKTPGGYAHVPAPRPAALQTGRMTWR